MASETYSVQDPSVTLTKYRETYALHLTLLNGEAAEALNQGTAVYLSGNNTVKKLVDGSEFPIGVVFSGGAAGTKLSVEVGPCVRDLVGISKGSALASGDFAIADGTFDADGRPNYVAASAGAFANAIVIAGGAEDSEIRLGILRTPYTVPAA